MKISVPESKRASSLGGDEMSAMRSLTLLLRRSCTSGLFADDGRIRAVTSCFHFLRYSNEKLDWVCDLRIFWNREDL